MRISDWSSDVCSSDLHRLKAPIHFQDSRPALYPDACSKPVINRVLNQAVHQFLKFEQQFQTHMLLGDCEPGLRIHVNLGRSHPDILFSVFASRSTAPNVWSRTIRNISSYI